MVYDEDIVEDVVVSEEEIDSDEDKVSETMDQSNAQIVDLSNVEENETFVLVNYEGSVFPGLVIKLKKSKVQVKCLMNSGLFNWKWPVTPDIHDYPPQDIVAIVKPPRQANNRGHLSIPEVDKYWL